MNFLQLIKSRLQGDKEYKIKYIKRNSPTGPRGGKARRRGLGVTRRLHTESKQRRKQAAASRKINYKYAQRKRL